MVAANDNNADFYRERIALCHKLNNVDNAKIALLDEIVSNLYLSGDNNDELLDFLGNIKEFAEDELAACLIANAKEYVEVVKDYNSGKLDKDLALLDTQLASLQSSLKYDEKQRVNRNYINDYQMDNICIEGLVKSLSDLVGCACEQKNRGKGSVVDIEVVREGYDQKLHVYLKIAFECEDKVKKIDINYWLDRGSITIFKSGNNNLELAKEPYRYICSDEYYEELCQKGNSNYLQEIEDRAKQLKEKIDILKSELAEKQSRRYKLSNCVKNFNEYIASLRKRISCYKDAGIFDYWGIYRNLREITEKDKPLFKQRTEADFGRRADIRERIIVLQLAFDLIGILIFGESFKKEWQVRQTSNYIVGKLCLKDEESNTEHVFSNTLLYYASLVEYVGETITEKENAEINLGDVQTIDKTFRAWYFADPLGICDEVQCSYCVDKDKCWNIPEGVRILKKAGNTIYSQKSYSEFYFKVYLPKYINQVVDYLKNKNIQQLLTELDEVKVLALGCGPANDLFALEYLQKTPGNALYGKTIKYVGVDSGDSWISEQETLKNCESDSLEINFIQGDIRDFVLRPEGLDGFKPNLILMNYVLSDMQKFNSLEIMEAIMQDSKQKTRIVKQNKASLGGRKIYFILNENDKLDFKMKYASYRLDRKLEIFVENLVSFINQYGESKAIFIASDYYDGSATVMDNTSGIPFGNGNIPGKYLGMFVDEKDLHQIAVRDNPSNTTLSADAIEAKILDREKEMTALVENISDFRGNIINGIVSESRRKYLALFNYVYSYFQKKD